LRLPQSELLAPPGKTAVSKTEQAEQLFAKQNAAQPGQVLNSAAVGREIGSPSASSSLKIRDEDRHDSKPDRQLSCQVFAYLESLAKSVKSTTASPGLPSPSKNKTVPDHFTIIEEHMWNRTTVGDRIAYRSIEEVHRSIVHEELDSERQSFDRTTPSLEQQRNFDTRVSLFNSADAVFSFFFPQDTCVVTTRRFWGAVLTIVKNPFAKRLPDPGAALSEFPSASLGHPRWLLPQQFDVLLTSLGEIRTDILAFTECFSNIEESEQVHIKPPSVLIDAWVHMILALATFPSNQHRFMELAKRARSEINAGMKELVAARSQPLGVKDMMVLPCDLVALMAIKLMRNVAPTLPDIETTYGSYLELIDSDIATGHPDRKIEHKLGLFRQELSVLRWLVDIQGTILPMLLHTRDSVAKSIETQFVQQKDGPGEVSAKVSQGPQYQPEIFPFPYIQAPRYGTMASIAERALELGEWGGLEPRGFSYMLLHDCLGELSAKREALETMDDVVVIMTETNRNNIASTKDRQERAIYAFTIVTIVFLPLSAVASVFRMNSSDIRDMDLGQWAYWATAIPVTAVVVFLGLLFMGELGNVRCWVEGRIDRWWESRRDDLGLGGRPGWGQEEEGSQLEAEDSLAGFIELMRMRNS